MWFWKTAGGVPNYREHCTVLPIKQVRPPSENCAPSPPPSAPPSKGQKRLKAYCRNARSCITQGPNSGGLGASILALLSSVCVRTRGHDKYIKDRCVDVGSMHVILFRFFCFVSIVLFTLFCFFCTVMF